MRALRAIDVPLGVGGGRRGDVHLLLNVAVERVGRAGNAADLARHGIEGAARRIFALDDRRRFEDLTHLPPRFFCTVIARSAHRTKSESPA
ncbi:MULTISPECIES: hypothetical protein [unclassified Bradyrhizobium]|uniref:hypothetical protein n=1 Tax=unclassified Bradyrhizobium TaxID=2631580 RepID=UPI0028E3F419|nr:MULTISPECIES: hypothetical protein [unclassified Bradyrhizobium]